MESWAKWTARTVLVTTGLATASCGITGVAFAGTGGTNTGNVSVLGGNHVNAPVSIPADVCGNAAAILGIATAGCQGGAFAAAGGPGQSNTAAAHTDAASTAGSSGPEYGNVSIGHGNTVKVPVIVAADACGNSIGGATAKCHGGIHLPAASTWQSSSSNGTIKQAGMAAGNLSVGDGNDVQVPVTAPIDACGNAAAVLGDSSAGCEGGATVGDLAPQTKHVVNGGPLKKVTKVAHTTAKKITHSGKKVPQAVALSGPVESVPALRGVPGLPVVSALNGLSGQNSQSGLTRLTKGANLTAAAGVTKAPGLTKASGLTKDQGLTRHSTLMPASTLTAAERGIPMSNTSFASLAIGVLLAGAAALKLANRGPRSRKARSGQVSA
jgi:hypothetical protein